MSAPTTHTTTDGSTFRISLIQARRQQSLFLGQHFTFLAEWDDAPEGRDATFELRVHYSPIAIAIASPEDRLRTDEYAEAIAKRMLDAGTREDCDIRVTSDGAVMVGEQLVDRVFPLAAA